MKGAAARKSGDWNTAAPAASERWLTIALAVSCLGHAAVLAVQLCCVRWGPLPPILQPTKVIYEQEPMRRASEWARGAEEPPQERLNALVRSMTVTVPVAAGDDGVGGVIRQRREMLSGVSQSERDSGVGEAVGGADSDAHSAGAWAAAVDLTNIAEAAQNNPVLLGYFGAIRERIQRTANTHGQVPAGTATDGIVYVGFVIGSKGVLQRASVVSERSVASPQLCDVALQIVKASSPFLPFPPSFKGTSKTIVIPIEFAFGS